MTIENAKLFIEKSRKLEDSPFWAWMNQTVKKPNEELIQGGTIIMQDDLREEDLESFCLILRMLIQDKDGFSISKMKVFSKSFAPQFSQFTNEIIEATEKLNINLDSKSIVQLNKPKKTTNRVIFDFIFYGGIVHSNEGKRHVFQEISSGQISWFAFNDFTTAITRFRNCYMAIAYNLFHYLDGIGEI
jgi:hypothetical protein